MFGRKKRSQHETVVSSEKLLEVDFASIDEVFASLKPKKVSLAKILAPRSLDLFMFSVIVLSLFVTALTFIFIGIVVGFTKSHFGNSEAYGSTAFSFLLSVSWAWFLDDKMWREHNPNGVTKRQLILSRFPSNKKKKLQRDQQQLAQSFLNEQKIYGKLFESFVKLSKDARKNQVGLNELRREWSRLRLEDVTRARMDLREARQMIERLSREAEIEENGLVLTSIVDSDRVEKINSLQSDSTIQDKVRS